MEQIESEISEGSLGDVSSRSAGNIIKMTSGQLTSIFVLTVSAFIIPRMLGTENYGIYAAVLAVISLLYSFSSFGLQQVGMRYLGPKGGWALDLISSTSFYYTRCSSLLRHFFLRKSDLMGISGFSKALQVI